MCEKPHDNAPAYPTTADTSPPVEHESVPTAQGEPKSTTLAPSEPELATVLTPNPMPQREPTLAPKTEPMPQKELMPEPTPEPTLHG